MAKPGVLHVPMPSQEAIRRYVEKSAKASRELSEGCDEITVTATQKPDGSIEFTTKDSGARAQYDSGMVRDTNQGKARFELCVPLDLPYDQQMLTRFAALMARGAEKYNPRNWEQAKLPEELERYKESAFRHFMQWLTGMSDEDHAAAVYFNIMGAEYVKARMAKGE